MNNNTLRIKVKQRLNKLASNDYDNLQCWQIAEAFNKAQIEWVRRQLHGGNPYKEGDEQSISRIDDLQPILKSISLNMNDKKLYYESIDKLPKDYLRFKRVSIKGKNDTCGARKFKVYLGEEANRDELLSDANVKPSFDWAETFCTLIGNHVRIYTDNLFDIVDPSLTYYREPREIKFAGCANTDTGELYTVDIESEFNDNIVELIIDEACAIMAGDTENVLQMQRETQNAERNN